MIAVLDFGSQYTHLITRKLREFGVYSEIFPHDVTSKTLPKNTTGVILSGGPSSVYEKNAPSIEDDLLNSNLPILGICYGQQLIAHKLGGVVTPGKSREYGKKTINVSGGKLLKGLGKKETVWFSHGDLVKTPPPGFRTTSISDGVISSIENERIFGVQFHPEVAHTLNGDKIIENFIKISGEARSWNIENQVERLVEEIKSKVSDNPVLIGVSGGVDSLVASLLLHKALEDQLFCVFIDTGLMRKGEAEEVAKTYQKTGFKNFLAYDASKDFLNALKGVSDPEEKRKIIGHTFIRVFEKVAKELKGEKKIKFLAQGTIYPDRVESASTSSTSHKIKSHHNLTLPPDLDFQIIEPLKDFYKDEVRDLGKKLGLPKEILGRHPFPGPGLAIRILGEVTQDKLDILKEADSIYIEELKKSGQYDKIWQAFAVLLPIKTVGVMGDARTYEYIISLRAVTSRDGMTADWAKIPYEVLEKISSRIVNEVRGVNRVLFDITQKPPATIEYE